MELPPGHLGLHRIGACPPTPIHGNVKLDLPIYRVAQPDLSRMTTIKTPMMLSLL